MMTSANTPVQNSENLFKEAIDIFFGHNPKYPLWILLVLYLRKVGKLRIAENVVADNDEDNLIWGWSRGADIEYAKVSFSDETVERWMKDGISNLNIIGDIASSNELVAIARSFYNEPANTDDSSAPFRPQWEPSFLLEVVSRLLSIDDKWYMPYLDKAIDNVILRIFSTSRFRGEYMQPQELSEVAVEIMHMLANIGTVYNPCCGIGTYITADPPYISFYGEDVNPVIQSIAELRMLWYEYDDASIKCCDSTQSSFSSYEAMISTPPFEPMRNSTDNLAAQLIRRCVNDGKVGVFILPAGFSFSHLKIKNELIDCDAVSGIVMLPAGLFAPYTGIQTMLVVVNPQKDDTQRDKVTLLDARTFIDEKTNVLQSNRIMDAWKSESEYKVVVSNTLIRSKDYSLEPENYYEFSLNVPAGSKLMSIDEIGNFIGTQIPEGQDNVRWATLSSLDNLNILKSYSSQEIALGKSMKSSIRIDEDCVWISPAGSRGAVLHIDKEPIYTHRNNIAFVPDKSIILPQYLILELTKEYVKRRLEFRRPTEYGKHLSKLRIVVPPLEDQRAAIADYQSSLIAKLDIENDILRSQREEEAKRELETRKHRIGQVLNDVIPSFESLYAFIESSSEPLTRDTEVDKLFHTTLFEELTGIRKGLNKATDLLKHLTDTVSFSEVEDIDFCDFIARNAKELKPTKYPVRWFGELQENETPTFRFSEQDLKILFENIFSNARKYGFTDKNRGDYFIAVNFRCVDIESRPYLRIYVSNNGSPLPPGMNPTRVFEWGKGSGTGIGGAQIKSIVEHYGGSIHLEELTNDAEGFTIRYVIFIPLIETSYE